MRHLHDAPSRPDTTSVEGGVKVLLGSESGDFAGWLRSRLETEGGLVETAETGAAVVEMARGGYHVILVELESESVDGLAVLRELKSPLVAVQCPIVLIKGDDEPAHIVQRGLDLGAAGYIVKRRLPGSISMQTLLDAFGVTTPKPGSKRSPVLQMQRARSEACPFSARATFPECSAFMPITRWFTQTRGWNGCRAATCARARRTAGGSTRDARSATRPPARSTCATRPAEALPEVAAGNGPGDCDRAVPGAEDAVLQHHRHAGHWPVASDAAEGGGLRVAAPRPDLYGMVAARSGAATNARPSLPAHPGDIVDFVGHQSQHQLSPLQRVSLKILVNYRRFVAAACKRLATRRSSESTRRGPGRLK